MIACTAGDIDKTQRRYRIPVTLTLTGDYTTGGDTLDLTLGTTYSPGQTLPAQGPVLDGIITTSSGYSCKVRPGTTLANTLLQFFETGTAANDPLNELAAGAYPAGLTADTAITGWLEVAAL